MLGAARVNAGASHRLCVTDNHLEQTILLVGIQRRWPEILNVLPHEATSPETLSKGGQPVRNSPAVSISLLEFVGTVCFFNIASQKGLVFAPLIPSIN